MQGFKDMRRNQKIVYSAMNKVNNKSYIGYCTDFRERKTRHFLCAKKGIVTHFYNAIRKYGEENFEWKILFNNLESIEECKKIEKLMIALFDTYNNGYNATLGGDGGFTGHNTGEFKKGHKVWNQGMKMSKELVQKFKDADRSKQYKPVIQLDLNGNFIKEWESIKSAKDALSIFHIYTVAMGKRKTAGGFNWKYKTDYNEKNVFA